MSEAARVFVHGFVAASSWAIGFLGRALFVRVPVAVIVLVLSVIVTLYALWTGVILWFITGRFGIARSVARPDLVERSCAALLPASLALLSAVGGRSVANATVIGIFASCGSVLWQRRRDAVHLVLARLPYLPGPSSGRR